MKCENCGNSHNGIYGSGRFCSKKCSHSFSTKNNREKINKKIGETIQKKYPKIKKKCKWCEKSFKVKQSKKQQQTCSRSCAVKLRLSTPEAKNKLSEHFSKIAKERYERGDETIGWQSLKTEMSKPEKFTKKWLEEKNLTFIKDHKVGRYFIDFAFIKEKVALEIDGKQHTFPERKKSDKKKDIFLREKGWKIIRVKFYGFKNLKEIKGKIYSEVEKYIAL